MQKRDYRIGVYLKGETPRGKRLWKRVATKRQRMNSKLLLMEG